MTNPAILYRLFTGLLVTFVILAGIPDLFSVPQAVALFEHLGFPPYLLPFLGVAKLLGAIGIVAPRLPKVREWAYAGLAFDFSGALYSHLSVGDPMSAWWGLLVGAALLIGSYSYYTRMTPAPTAVPARALIERRLDSYGGTQ